MRRVNLEGSPLQILRNLYTWILKSGAKYSLVTYRQVTEVTRKHRVPSSPFSLTDGKGQCGGSRTSPRSDRQSSIRVCHIGLQVRRTAIREAR